VVVGLLQTQKIGRQRSNRKKRRGKKKTPIFKKRKKQKKKKSLLLLFSLFLSVRVQKDKTNDISDQRADFNSFSGFDFKTGTKKS
jgi:hypothetical protein